MKCIGRFIFHPCQERAGIWGRRDIFHLVGNAYIQGFGRREEHLFLRREGSKEFARFLDFYVTNESPLFLKSWVLVEADYHVGLN